MIRRSQESTPQKPFRPATSPFTPSSETREDIVRLETQKKILLNKLTQLSHDFTAEERWRRQLEEEVLRERGRASGVLQRSLEIEKPSERLQTMHKKLDNVREELQGQLDVLTDLRRKLDLVRRDPFALRPSRPACASLPDTSVARAPDGPREIFTRLTETEKAPSLRTSASGRSFRGCLRRGRHKAARSGIRCTR
jgi:hypothetical protein